LLHFSTSQVRNILLKHISGFTKADWETVVKSMIDMGADIKPTQVTVITAYLAENFPPKTKK
jgi:hypothetical protein